MNKKKIDEQKEFAGYRNYDGRKSIIDINNIRDFVVFKNDKTIYISLNGYGFRDIHTNMTYDELINYLLLHEIDYHLINSKKRNYIILN